MSPIVREHYRVPREDRATLFRPAPADLPALVERNRRLIGSWNFEVAGRPVAVYRAAARAEAVVLALAYAARWGFTVPGWVEPAPLVVTGHQPPPFHPGVWLKNFLAGSLAAAVGGAGLNLVVDTDEAHGQAVRFPVQAPGEDVHVAEFPLAAAAPGLALEEQPPSSLNLGGLVTCTEAACSAASLVAAGPMARALERSMLLVRGAAAEASSLAEATTVARRRLEEELGLRNFELPVSRLADGEAFRLFVAEMLGRHAEFFAAYNDTLAEYRRAYRERSPAQPVPDLARDGERIELPLWVWRAGEPRRRLWVAPTHEERAHQDERLTSLTLMADHETVGTLDAAELGDAAAIVSRLDQLRRAGWKIRPRALAMTLFVRLAIADTFIHGLGGALYDRVTDGIFERLYGVRPPELAVASCTVYLPLEGYPSTPRDLDAAVRAVRDWRHNPDRMLSDAVRAQPAASAMIDEKRRLVAVRAATREGRAAAFRRIHAINEALIALDPDGPRRADARLADVRREVRWNGILRDREYPFWFYPAEEVGAFFGQAVAAK